jgi:4-diphosphocytidyl-2-C-methyl-D-erythritol kinase
MNSKFNKKTVCPAKINLFLHITGKRPDNYHELITLMCCIGIYDTLWFTFKTDKTTVSCDDPQVPDNGNNLAYKAANCFFRKLNSPEHVGISIEKHIPVAAGLGGGSSNAATVLRELNEYYNYPFSREQLADMGLSIGADVPFFIYQKPAIATGIGEALKPCYGLEAYEILLIFPGFSVSTADAYKKLNLGLTKYEKKLNYSLFQDPSFNLQSHLHNDLESITIAQYPEIIAVKESLLNYGATGALMSGSGPSVFGIFPDSDAAQKTKLALSKNKKWKVYLVKLLV